MYCTVKEIIRDVLDTDVPDSECVFAVVLTRGDVRHIAQDWNLSDDELETVMQRLDDAFEYGADVSIVHDVVRELMEEKRASRQVTVPAVMLEKVMALAGSEMKRLYAVGSENGGDGDAFVREEREAMDVVLQAVHDVVRELMEEKRASRQVTVPAVMLEKVMALAGSEMKRLYAVGSENGGDGDAFVREEREAMDVVLQALDGEHMS